MAAEAEAAREARAKAIQVSIDEDNHQVVDIKMTISGIGGGKSCKELARSWRGDQRLILYFVFVCIRILYFKFCILFLIFVFERGHQHFILYFGEVIKTFCLVFYHCIIKCFHNLTLNQNKCFR